MKRRTFPVHMSQPTTRTQPFFSDASYSKAVLRVTKLKEIIACALSNSEVLSRPWLPNAWHTCDAGHILAIRNLLPTYQYQPNPNPCGVLFCVQKRCQRQAGKQLPPSVCSLLSFRLAGRNHDAPHIGSTVQQQQQ